MLRNYSKILFRNLSKNKTFSFINILGLSIGMATSLMIILWVQHENGIEKFHKHSDRLFAIYNRENDGIKQWVNNNTPQILGSTLQEKYPEVEAVSRQNYRETLFTVGDKKLKTNGLFVDSAFLNMFSFPLVEGQTSDVLNAPNMVVLTEKLAIKLFGEINPVGKSVTIDSATQLVVSGVLQDLPNNTDFKFEYLLPWSYAKSIGWKNDSWGANSTTTYLQLEEGVSAKKFEAKIKNISKDHTKNEPIQLTAEVFLHPINRKHLYNKDINGYLITGDIQKVKTFSVIAVLILLIACINFMNLSTAKSEKRAKEVGIRKVVGVRKSGLMLQFIFESVFLSIISFVFALMIAYLTIPMYAELVGTKMNIPIQEPNFWIFSMAFILITGLLAGSYPAFFLSSFNPVKALKGTRQNGKNGINTRKILVVLQFTVAITLIISTIIIYNQIQYGLDREVGYDRSQLIYLPVEGNVKNQYQSIKNELLNSGAVLSMSLNRGPITQRSSDQWGLEWEGSTEQDVQTTFVTMGSNSGLVQTMGFTLIAGRDIDIDNFPTDSNAAVLNESAIKAMHLQDPIGKIIYHKGYREDNYHIVGVVNDFIIESPFMDKINPVLITGPKTYYANTLHIRLSDRFDTKTSLEKIEQVFKHFNSEYPFEYKFVDETFSWKFASSQRTSKLITLFACLTIFISCLGLFGLAAYMVENRTKEISVRKVLGATTFQVSHLLSKEFLVLICIAFIIAAPIAWYAMNQWIKEYTYNSGISWIVFAVTGISTVLITLLTISWQSIGAALANPVKSLRNE